MAGNTTITLYNGKGTTTFEVWLQTISTGSQNEFATQQVRDKLSWIPIRRAQMFLTFSIAWPLITNRKDNGKFIKRELGFEDIDPADGFAKLQKFQDTLWIHQQSMVNGSIPNSMNRMIVNYNNNSDKASPIFNTLISKEPLKPLKYEGWIQTVEKQYVRFQNVYVTSYQMNVLTQNSNNALVFYNNASAMIGGRSITYAPTAADQQIYGTGWVDTSTTGSGLAAVAKSLKIIPQ